MLYANGALAISRRPLMWALVLTVGESLANMNYANMISRHQPLRANALFSVRAGLWVFPVVALGLWSPVYRTVDTVFFGWGLGLLASFAALLPAWKNIPWHKAFDRRIDWAWMKASVRKTFFIWLGAMGVTVGVYIDRFVVMHFLGLDYVGITTIYFSFANALFALLQSGVFSFAYPRLILMHREGDRAGFHRETRHMGRDVALFSGLAAIGMGIAVAVLGPYLQEAAAGCLPAHVHVDAGGDLDSHRARKRCTTLSLTGIGPARSGSAIFCS